MVKLWWRSVWAVGLLLFAPGAFAPADESQKLPESYAEVRLNVEGMT